MTIKKLITVTEFLRQEEAKVLKKYEIAFPQFLAQKDLKMKYVEKWKKTALSALKNKKGSSSLTKHKLGVEVKESLYHFSKSPASGVWFISVEGKTIDFLYAYQGVVGLPGVAEALAYSFNTEVRGVMPLVFWNFFLPDKKFIVTDYLYTPDGHRWFVSQYHYAFQYGYNVYAIDLTDKDSPLIQKISRAEFKELQSKYWGLDDEHQQYRFAIELP